MIRAVFRLLPALLVATHAVGVDSDEALKRYFESRTDEVSRSAFANLTSLESWKGRRPELRRQLFDMLGLWPLPPRTELHATVTGSLEREDIVVEKLHFQSLPGLYVTANLYRPRQVTEPLPTILYACGHAVVKTNGIRCGNKAGYQHHGIWFARHGYVCLLIDTLQLGEIEGDHHGTYRLGQWWWNSRGYTPAGVEAWNCIRALDYLETRPEVDRTRIGMTGRSGGGSYTWTTIALDDRIRVAAPVAGITDLRNHIVDDTVEGHCDCMFFVNTYRWDFGLNAALFAPKPLLIVNTDSDTIFPLDGVIRIHSQVRRVYDWHHALTNLGLVIAPGPHRDTQDLQVPVFRWFNRHLRNEDPLITEAAVKLFDPLELRVFDRLPTDERNTVAQQWFGPDSALQGRALSDPGATLLALKQRVFGGWPGTLPGLSAKLIHDRLENGLRRRTWSFQSEADVPLQLHLLAPRDWSGSPVTLHVIDEGNDEASVLEKARQALAQAHRPQAVFAPRGVGSGAWSGDAREQIHIRRRFMLLGQTLDGMRVWDIRRAVDLLQEVVPGIIGIEITGTGRMSSNILLASLFQDGVTALRLPDLPASFRQGPDYLNILQILDIPDARQLARRQGIAFLPTENQ